MKRQKLSDWSQKGIDYAQGLSSITELPPHRPDFYLSAMSVIANDPENPLRKDPKHPFWSALEDQLESGSIAPEQLGFSYSLPVDEVTLSPDVQEDMELNLVVGPSPAMDWRLAVPVDSVCHHAHASV